MTEASFPGASTSLRKRGSFVADVDALPGCVIEMATAGSMGGGNGNGTGGLAGGAGAGAGAAGGAGVPAPWWPLGAGYNGARTMFGTTWLTRDLLTDAAAVISVGVSLALAASFGEAKVHYIPTDYIPQYSYPLLHQTVPSWAVPLVAFPLPLLVFVLHKLAARRPWVEVLRLALTLACCVLLTALITECLKVTVSRPRPNFVAACWPSGVSAEWVADGAYGGYPNCSAEPSEYADHIKSFPSGHASMSMAGLGFLSWWLLGVTRTFAGPAAYWRLVLSSLPWLGALAIAISRVTDFWHHPTDIIVGMLLGIVVSFGFYRMGYPAFTSPACHVPMYELLPSFDRGASGGLYSPRSHRHHRREVSPHALGGAGAGGGLGQREEGEEELPLSGVVAHGGSGNV